MDPDQAVGFSLLTSPEGDIRRYVVFSDFNMVPEEDIPPMLLESMSQRLPLLDKERRASHLPMALLLQLRSCLEKQNVEIDRLKNEEHMENDRLRRLVLQYALENDEEKIKHALIEENLILRDKNRLLKQQMDVFSFRDQLDKTKVAALQAIILRMMGAIWSFAPVGKELSAHNDPYVRECYETNLSLLTMMQENCKCALKNCQDLL